LIKITPAITREIERHIGTDDVPHADAFPVQTYRELMQHVARLAYLNKDNLLFFRGQATDYRNSRNASTLYPSIYRGNRLSTADVTARFDLLSRTGRRLAEVCQKQGVEGAPDLVRRPMVQWAVLQHYEVSPTPFIDLTHSLRVACSFAQMSPNARYGFIYVLALPHLTNRITVNSEHDLITVRLLSICPPAALRPYFQEGYLAGTADITVEYNPKTELDFNRRLVAKFSIPNDAAFWGPGLSRIPESELYPEEDSMKELCDVLKLASESPQQGDGDALMMVGEFLAAWTAIELRISELAQGSTGKLLTPIQALRMLHELPAIPPDLRRSIEDLRRLRNELVHSPVAMSGAEVSGAIRSASGIVQALNKLTQQERRGHAT
jgi:hypothetical protein